MPKTQLKRFEGLEEEITKILNKEGPQTTATILAIVEGKYPATWKTINSYLKRLQNEKEIQFNKYGSVGLWSIA